MDSVKETLSPLTCSFSSMSKASRPKFQIWNMMVWFMLSLFAQMLHRLAIFYLHIIVWFSSTQMNRKVITLPMLLLTTLLPRVRKLTWSRAKFVLAGTWRPPFGPLYRSCWVCRLWNAMINTWACLPWWEETEVTTLVSSKSNLGNTSNLGNGSFWARRGKKSLSKPWLQAIPIYTMGCFLFPKVFCDDLNRLIASYFWNRDVGNQKIHWCSWDCLCATKAKGGLRFRNILAFNYAMLAKQDWRILTEPNSLVAKVLKAKYFLNSSFLDAWVNLDASYCWKSICSAHRILFLRIRWQVGNGLNIQVWDDPWLPLPSLFRPYTPRPSKCNLSMVCNLINVNTKSWLSAPINCIFSPEEARLIHIIPLSFRSPPDTLMWHFEKSGKFSVKNAYHLARGYLHLPNDGVSSTFMASGMFWNRLVGARVPPKVKMCVWSLCHDFIPSRANLVKRHITSDSFCVFFDWPLESVIHFMGFCPFAKAAWFSSFIGMPIRDLTPLSFMGWITNVARNSSPDHFEATLMICWAIWKA